jgi:outer membrane protein OmpA-like peptidoglycan-associated protein
MRRVPLAKLTCETGVFLIFLLAVFPVGAQDPRARAQEFFRTAVELGRGVSATDPELLRQKADFYGKAVETDPSYAEAWNNLGYVQENLGRFEEALRCYRRALELNPEMAVAYLGLGDVHSQCGRYKEAIEAYESALRARGLSAEDRHIVEDHLQAARSLSGVSSTGIVAKEQIISMLRPPMVVRGASIEVSPKISFSEHAIGFQYNSSALLPQGRAQLDELAAALHELQLSPENQNKCYEIGGHTDARGTAEANYQLGLKRAETVRDYVVKKYGETAGYLVVKSYGKSALIQPNARTEEEHAINRRVEITKLEAKPQGPEAADLSLAFGALRRVGSNAVERIVSGQSVLNSGDRYQIYVRPSTSCHVYIYQKDSRGGGTWIFPCKECGVTNPVQAGTEYWFPRRDLYLRLDDNTGEETIYLMASRLPAADIEHAMKNLAAAGNADEAFVLRGLGGTRPGPAAKSVRPPVEEIFGRGGALYTKIIFKHVSAAKTPLVDSGAALHRR